MTFKQFYFTEEVDPVSARIQKVLSYQDEQIKKNAENKVKSKQTHPISMAGTHRKANVDTPHNFIGVD